ncbi:MAG: PspC domain-containing protein [Flavobacteriaceae bacterium]|nr:PspC domain-containing protein [Flavobacteriaceae bacterium]
MNKTININLGSIFFHIDESAYQKLKQYLEAIRRSLSDDPQGKDEIISDIEARIAELLSERVKNERQVINETDIVEVTKIMGQPEDYAGDEEFFEEQPKTQKSRSNKKLFRDGDDKFLGGVSSGMAHYLGIDTFWMRVIWIALTPFTSGMNLLLYPFLWILLPEAQTTAEKLQMKGEAVNISNIEKKIREELTDISAQVKEGASDFSEKVKNTDYKKYEKKAKSGLQDILETLGKIFKILFKILGKFMGVLIIFIAASTLLCLIIALFSWVSFEVIGFGGNLVNFPIFIYDSIIPFWLLGILFFIIAGIPFIVLFILGLRILSSNVKSIGMTTKLSFLGIWIVAILGISFSGIEFAAQRAHTGAAIFKQDLVVAPSETFTIKMIENEELSNKTRLRYNEGYETVFDGDQMKLLSNRVQFDIKHTDGNVARIKIRKSAEAKSRLKANTLAESIDYDFDLTENNLLLNGYFLTVNNNKYRELYIDITVYLPEGTTLYLDKSTYSFLDDVRNVQKVHDRDMPTHLYKMTDENLYCLDCDEDDFGYNYDPNNDNFKLQIDENGILVKLSNNADSTAIKINKSGITID